MSEAAQKCPSLVTAWRVAYILTGCQEGATKVIQESIDELLQHPGVHDRHRLEMLFYSILRRRCLRFPARCELTGPLAELHALAEPDRSARVLLELNALDAEEIQHLLNVTKLPPAVPENPALVEALGQLLPTPEEDKQLVEAAEAVAGRHASKKFSIRNPASIAVGIGFLLMVAVLTWNFLGKAGTFPDEAIKLATQGNSAGAEQFDPVTQKTGDLQDWFMLKGFDNFRLPPGFDQFDAVGVRMFRYEGEAVAQAAAVNGDDTMFFYSFPSQKLGIDVVPEKSWRISQADRMVLAIREEGDVCFMVAFPGKKKDMEEFLRRTAK